MKKTKKRLIKNFLESKAIGETILTLLKIEINLESQKKEFCGLSESELGKEFKSKLTISATKDRLSAIPKELLKINKFKGRLRTPQNHYKINRDNFYRYLIKQVFPKITNSKVKSPMTIKSEEIFEKLIWLAIKKIKERKMSLSELSKKVKSIIVLNYPQVTNALSIIDPEKQQAFSTIFYNYVYNSTDEKNLSSRFNSNELNEALNN